ILGYSDAHISRIFSLYVKKSLPDYVNELRFKEVNRLIENTNGKITDLIFDAGFNSIQTYYRVKSKLTKN
ncbi:MAG: helix-turn-helix domain-containing protein, partial [Clostridia bacterium]|nr:helix-turn-helix domain-containing protein [Clostridia bacterium]